MLFSSIKEGFPPLIFFCSPFALPGMMERLCLLRYSINFIEGRASFLGNQSFGNLAAFMVSALYVLCQKDACKKRGCLMIVMSFQLSLQVA